MFRARELKERPAAIASLKEAMNFSQTFMGYVQNYTANLTASGNLTNETVWITPEELTTLETLYNETAAWLEEKTKAQAALPPTESPVLKVGCGG